MESNVRVFRGIQMKLLCVFCLFFIIGCLDTSDEGSEPVFFPPNDTELPPEDHPGKMEEDVQEEMDLEIVLEEVAANDVLGEENPITMESEETVNVHDVKSLPVTVQQSNQEESAQDDVEKESQNNENEGQSVELGTFIPTQPGPPEDEKTRGSDDDSPYVINTIRVQPGNPAVGPSEQPVDKENQEETGKNSDEEDDSAVPPEHAVTNIGLEPQLEQPPSSTEPSKPQEQKINRPGEPSKVKTGDEEKNSFFMFIEGVLTPVVDWFFETSSVPEEDDDDFVSTPKEKFPAAEVESSQLGTVLPSSTVDQRGKINSPIVNPTEDKKQTSTGLYTFFLSNEVNLLFLGLQKTLSDGREVFLLIEDEKANYFTLYGGENPNLPSIVDYTDFLKKGIVDHSEQYLPELCNYHTGDSAEGFLGYDWTVLSKEFGAFFPDEFHHPYIEKRYIISSIQTDADGIVEQVTLVNKMDSQKTYTLTRNNFVSGSEEVDLGIEEYVPYMESFFMNQDTLCLSSV